MCIVFRNWRVLLVLFDNHTGRNDRGRGECSHFFSCEPGSVSSPAGVKYFSAQLQSAKLLECSVLRVGESETGNYNVSTTSTQISTRNLYFT